MAEEAETKLGKSIAAKHFVTWRPSLPVNGFHDPLTAAMLTGLFLLALAVSSAVLGSPTQQQVIGSKAELSLSEKWSYLDCGKRILLTLLPVDEAPELIWPSRNPVRHHSSSLSGGLPRPSKTWPEPYGDCFRYSA